MDQICPSELILGAKRLETNIGGTLYIRAQRGRPMKLTALGAALVDAIRLYLADRYS
jgi:DNA-binding transcriptional LysR family regulator